MHQAGYNCSHLIVFFGLMKDSSFIRLKSGPRESAAVVRGASEVQPVIRQRADRARHAAP